MTNESVTPSFAFAEQTSDWANLTTNGVIDGPDPPTGSVTGDVLVPQGEHDHARPL